ncbi:MAG: hypothetical protein KDC38_16785 [Planctomycetes bacterium]|nr:hypothetical protein [Planctomycetota bacterium]
MRSRRWSWSTATIVLGSLLSVLGVDRANAQVYSIEEGQFTQGCLPPCLCPILLLGDLEGTFELSFTGFDGSFAVYSLTNFDAVATNFAGDQIPLTGAGEYRVDEGAELHEMTLDVSDSAGTTLAMNSGGSVPFADGVAFPDISIFIGTSLECFGSHISMVALPIAPLPTFIRADCNDDGGFDISDAIETLSLLFISGTSSCPNACDSNDDESLDISDAIFSLAALFSMGTLPAEPFPGCGNDPTQGTLLCGSFASCP